MTASDWDYDDADSVVVALAHAVEGIAVVVVDVNYYCYFGPVLDNQMHPDQRWCWNRFCVFEISICYPSNPDWLFVAGHW